MSAANEQKDEMKSLVAQIREGLGKDSKPEHQNALKYLETYANDACIKRHLRANKLKVGDAVKSLIATATWRLEFGVDQIDASRPELQLVLSHRTFFLSRGRDLEGRPVVVTYKPEGKEHEDYDSALRNIVYTLEKAIVLMPPEHEKWVWIMDLRHFSYSNSTPYSITKQTVDIFSKFYPERLHRAFIVDAPWAFRALWKLISPFLDSVTQNKIKFINDRKSKEFKDAIHAVVAQDQLESILGGDLSYAFDPASEPQGPIGQSFVQLRQQYLDARRPSQGQAEAKAEIEAKQN